MPLGIISRNAGYGIFCGTHQFVENIIALGVRLHAGGGENAAETRNVRTGFLEMLLKSGAQLLRAGAFDHFRQAFLDELLLAIVGVAKLDSKKITERFDLHRATPFDILKFGATAGGGRAGHSDPENFGLSPEKNAVISSSIKARGERDRAAGIPVF